MEKINQDIKTILLDEYNQLSQKLKNTMNDLTFLNYLIINKFSNNSGDDHIDTPDIKRLEKILFNENADKFEKEHMLLPTVLLMTGVQLNHKQNQDLNNILNIILQKIASLKEECSHLSGTLYQINKFVSKDNGLIIDYSNNNELIKLIYSLKINPEIKNKLLLQIMKNNATNYKLDTNTNKEYIKIKELEKEMIYSNFNFSLFEDQDKSILINRGILPNIGDVLNAIKDNHLSFFYSKKDGKYEYSHELTQILLESNSTIINDVCSIYSSIGGKTNKLSNMLQVFLKAKKENVNIPITTKEKKEALNQKIGRLSRRYDYFKENIKFFSSSLSNDIVDNIINLDSNIVIMEPQKLKARFNLFYKYGIRLQKKQIKTFLKLLYSTSSIQLTSMIDKYVELGFDPTTHLSYKKGIDDNLSKLSFKFSIDKIYYAKKNCIPVYNDKGNWYQYITVNDQSSNVFPSLREIREFIPNFVEQYYTYMNEQEHLIGSYYNILNNMSDEDFNNIENTPNNDIAQRIIDIFEAFKMDNYRYYLVSGKVYISRYKFIRNIKILQDKINNHNIVDIVLLCASNNSILTKQEYKALKNNIEQILYTKKKVL